MIISTNHLMFQLFFVNREKEINELIELYVKTYVLQTKIERDPTEERHLNLVVSTQMFGSGKTRF